MSLTGVPETVTGKGHTGRVTAMRAAFAILLFLWQSFIAWRRPRLAVVHRLEETAPFFGVHASRDDYIEAGMTCLTTLPAFAAMIWCPWQRGSRRGLWLIGGRGDGPARSQPACHHRWLPWPGIQPGPVLGDLFGQTTQVNWVAFVWFTWFALMTELFRWRERHTETGSAA